MPQSFALPVVRRHFICQSCLKDRLCAKGLQGARSVACKRSGRFALRRWATTAPVLHTTVVVDAFGLPPAPSRDKSSDASPAAQKPVPIRERLRVWASMNEDVSSSDMPADVSLYDAVSNGLSRTQASGSLEMRQLRTVEDELSNAPVTGTSGQDEEIARDSVHANNCGDLVELRQGTSRIPVLAIYLGFFGQRNHFYGINGRWTFGMAFTPLFTVSGFATPSELQPLLSKIPRHASPEEFEEMMENDKGPSREDGLPLIEKLTNFKKKWEAVHQEHMERLYSARSILADASDARFLSLFEIADILLPSSLMESDAFPPHALYAVHAALFRDPFGFRPLANPPKSHRRDHVFEVLPQTYTRTMESIVSIVREYTEAASKARKPLEEKQLWQLALGQFILEARKAVSLSRAKRGWTPYGILTTSPGFVLPKTQWSLISKEVIAFLEWWASYDLFTRASTFHSFGALILRALKLYDDVFLDQSIAWILLQELGVIAPWEIPSRYKVRLPEVSITPGGGLERAGPGHVEDSTRHDIAEDHRRKIEAPVFCIDGASTVVVDDGISLEPSRKPDEYWIHVHTADPASVIQPGSELCRFMELIPENVYLPGHFQPMLPSDLGEESQSSQAGGLIKQFSLHSEGPALTFSTLVNNDGEVLEYKIEPSHLGNVTYLVPEDVAAFCGEPAPPPFKGHRFSVGEAPAQDITDFAAESRPLTRTEDLDQVRKSDLLTLYRLAEAIKRKRIAKGAWPHFLPKPSISVSFHPTADSELQPNAGVAIPADPHIKVGEDPSIACSVVTNLMVLAGEIAARWCSSRKIPIPYRKDINLGTGALAYAEREIYPRIRQGVEPTLQHWMELAKLAGGVELATQPGPHFMLGLDTYAKTTSPLRRFGDLLVHWQIHAALAFERKMQRRIDATSDNLDELLPFSSAGLEDMLPRLQAREMAVRSLSRATTDWILMALVRAWRFENKAPKTLRFTVSSRWRQGLLGNIDLFDLRAALDVAGLDNLRLMKDVCVGDQFEVELADVNVHSRQILVKAKRYLGSAAAAARPSVVPTQAPMQQPTLTPSSDDTVEGGDGSATPLESRAA